MLVYRPVVIGCIRKPHLVPRRTNVEILLLDTKRIAAGGIDYC